MNDKGLSAALQNAGQLETAAPGLPRYREIPVSEKAWQRAGDLVRIKLADVEPALPEDVAATAVRCWRLVRFDGAQWNELPMQVDFSDGFWRWAGHEASGLDRLLCFHAPGAGVATQARWPGAKADDLVVPVMLWDSWHQSRCEGLFLVGAYSPQAPAPGPLAFRRDEAGLWVMNGKERLACFDPRCGYQLTYAALPGGGRNLIEEGRCWRWLLTETTGELAGASVDRVTFEPIVSEGFLLVARVAGENAAGRMSATLRVFLQSGALVMEFSDYRSVRARPELPPEEHPRYYAGQRASPYPGVHYAALCVDAPAGAQVFDHFHRFGPRDLPEDLELVYEAKRPPPGYNWMALSTSGGTAGIAVHGRTHEPDHPWKAGRVGGRATLALEPFGSIVNGHYHACDRYTILLARDVEHVSGLFDALDSFPILARVPLRRAVPVLDVYDRVCRWVNLNLDYLMKGETFRNALLTDGRFQNDAPTCMAPIGELIRLYEKTGWRRFKDEAVRAADVAAAWIEAGRFYTRGEGLDPDGGGIHQSEQTYLLLSMARVARLTGSDRLRAAIEKAVAWLYDQRGGLNTWGWKEYLWHAGGFWANGKPIYHWPVNTNQWATLNFRLYQLLGDRRYYENAMQVLADYLHHTPPDAEHIVRGGGISDTTRGVHFFTELMEVAGDDPRMDTPFWRRRLRETLERFWVRGWVRIRNSIYMEVSRPGKTPPETFSPGFSHCHSVGSFLDILPRIQIAAEAGVSEHLTRWAARDLALEFDLRYGMEEHTHFTRFGIRDTDIEPASWLDPELLTTMWAVRRRGWMDDEDYALLQYKVYRMALETFIPLDDSHGGWAAAYDVADGRPIRVLNQECAHRHPHERFGAGEPYEMWGLAAREAYHDHSTHYWTPMEQFVDALGTVVGSVIRDGVQTVRWREEGLNAGVESSATVLVPKAPDAERIELLRDGGGEPRPPSECRVVKVGGAPFWLVSCPLK
jgi:hypothetical protein